MSDQLKAETNYGTTSNTVYLNLKESILCGELVAGQQLKQAAIAKEYQISAIPVREAFRLLSADGLVDIIERKGAVVRTVDIQTVLQGLTVRYNLEPLALSWAIPNLSTFEIEKAKRLNEEQMQEPDIFKRVLINKELHLTLIRPCQYPPIIHFLESIFNQNIISPQTRLLHQADIASSIDDHADVIRHCEMFEVFEACNSLKDHINQSKLHINQTKKML